MPVPRPTRRKGIIALVLGLVAVAILCALGTWQVERLHWKQAIIERIDARIHAAPQTADAIETQVKATGDVEYLPVTVTGRFLNGAERFFLSTFEGQSGWNVHVPMDIGGNRFVIVNRGFVPYELKDPAKRPQSQIEGETTVTGLARDVYAEKPFFMIPDNDIGRNQFFWRSLPDITAGAGLPAGAKVLDFVVDAGEGRAPGGWPAGGTTVIDIPNNHLQYAITWYGLALVLAAMLGYQVYRAWRPVTPSGPDGA
ncbi:SURF1 family protein [Aureimonas psammosilenae]|uniref:SURF1 family protein n=1 Tax=Aureimonas psammosilenae TaxID=2495496 RepID=UPI00126099B0|nr:SURF1 family protein [Aureimonas psammosilenae]